MKSLSNCLLLFFLVSGLLPELRAQSLTNSSLGTVGGNSGQLMISTHPMDAVWKVGAYSVIPTTLDLDDQVVEVLGLKEFEESFDLIVYPNPFAETLQISEPVNGSIYIYSMEGRLAFSLLNQHNLTEVSLPLLPAGAYQLLIVDEENSRTKTLKLFKSK